MKDSSKTNYPRVGIGVLIFDQDKLLLGQRQQSHGNATWGPPGGHLEFGEEFEECACREVKEETGLIIANPTLFAVTNDLFPQESKHYISIFLTAPYPKEQDITNLLMLRT
ncbi:NUDIX hydrolase [Legionella sp. km772]|uniref:nucleotide triphosphate diphosphatase NUDT15 n=1 Tax=Legionella sp. km772 TaxID=2498111 RepID=UPI000F8CB10F|nr:NUDIX domain-containing protein [Legionella sp. km772]RUR09862.1 NUDIX domain-containing protein [Legionella sp. km772]